MIALIPMSECVAYPAHVATVGAGRGVHAPCNNRIRVSVAKSFATRTPAPQSPPELERDAVPCEIDG